MSNVQWKYEAFSSSEHTKGQCCKSKKIALDRCNRGSESPDWLCFTSISSLQTPKNGDQQEQDDESMSNMVGTFPWIGVLQGKAQQGALGPLRLCKPSDPWTMATPSCPA